MNPFYNPDKLDLDLLSFDKSSGSYEYDTICFWATKDGLVYTAQDSGCSCPTPFESHDCEAREDVLASLERVESVQHAESEFDTWNRGYGGGKPVLDADERRELTEWVTKHLKP